MKTETKITLEKAIQNKHGFCYEQAHMHVTLFFDDLRLIASREDDPTEGAIILLDQVLGLSPEYLDLFIDDIIV